MKNSMFSCKAVHFFFLVFPLFMTKKKKYFLTFYLFRRLVVKCHRVAMALLYRLPAIRNCFVDFVSRSTHIHGQIPNGDKGKHDKQKV